MSASTEEASPGLPEQLANGALAGAWSLDPARSTVAVRSRSMWGLLPVKGVFREVEGAGTVTADGQLTGQMTLKAASLDTKIAKRDQHLRSDHFFGSDTYPAIIFTLAHAEPTASGMTVSGTLAIRDQSRPISFPATVTLAGAEASFDATVQVDRAEFGMTFNQMNMTSMQNTVTIHAVFTKD